MSLDAIEPNPLRVMLVDSNLTFRNELCRMIMADKSMRLVDKAGTTEELFAIGSDLIIDLDMLILDIDLPDHSSVEAARWVRKHNPETAVLMLCNWDWDIYLVTAWSAGAAGILLRRELPRDLLSSIRHASAGMIYSEEQFQRIKTWEERIGSRLKTLLLRERQVLILVMAGRTNYQIGKTLSLSENMVEKYVSKILDKMHLTSRTLLLSYILANHLDIYIELNMSIPSQK